MKDRQIMYITFGVWLIAIAIFTVDQISLNSVTLVSIIVAILGFELKQVTSGSYARGLLDATIKRIDNIDKKLDNMQEVLMQDRNARR